MEQSKGRRIRYKCFEKWLAKLKTKAFLGWAAVLRVKAKKSPIRNDDNNGSVINWSTKEAYVMTCPRLWNINEDNSVFTQVYKGKLKADS